MTVVNGNAPVSVRRSTTVKAGKTTSFFTLLLYKQILDPMFMDGVFIVILCIVGI